MNRTTATLFTALALFASAACTSAAPSSSAGHPDGGATSATVDPEENAATVSPEVLEKICKTRHVDESSKIFFAKANGVLKRIEVTPSRRIADHGNLIFDLEGNHLGDTTGGEFSWDDKALMATENARVAALMAGAEIDGAETSHRCK